MTDRRVGKLLSVNVGLPKDVAWHGRTVHTAAWKRPVDGPAMARRLNIDGDGQGSRPRGDLVLDLLFLVLSGIAGVAVLSGIAGAAVR